MVEEIQFLFKSLVTDITGVKHFPLVFCTFVLQLFLAAVKPQVAVLAGKGVLVTYAAPVQHHHELPCHTALSTYRSR